MEILDKIQWDLEHFIFEVKSEFYGSEDAISYDRIINLSLDYNSTYFSECLVDISLYKSKYKHKGAIHLISCCQSILESFINDFEKTLVYRKYLQKEKYKLVLISFNFFKRIIKELSK